MQRGRAAAGMEAAFPVQAAQCENLMCDNFAHAECTPDYAAFNCPLSSSPHAHRFVLGTAVTHTLPLRVWVWDWVHTSPHTHLHTLSSSRHPPFTQYLFPLRSLVRDGQTSPHMPRLVVPHSTCPSLTPSPPAHSFITGPAVINTHTHTTPPLRHCQSLCAAPKGTFNRVETASYKEPSARTWPRHTSSIDMYNNDGGQ